MSEWGGVAALYDLQLPLERPALRTALDLADPLPQERLLDLGTGTAGVLRELARRHARPARVIGIDVSREMLARAPALPDGWELRLADARSLPFDDESFDVVTAAYLLHIVEETARPQIVRECARVLRAGGRLVTVTPAPPRSLLFARFLSVTGRPSGPFAGLRPLDPRPELSGCGFSVTGVRRVLRGYPSLCVLARRPEPSPTVA